MLYADAFIVAGFNVSRKPFDEGITMAEPNLNGYIFVTRKNFLSDDNEGRMVEKSFLKIQGTFLLHHLSYNNDGIEADEYDNPDDIAEIFKIEGNLFDFETPLCKAFNEFNNLLKIDTNLFTFDIQEIKTYELHKYELNNNMTGDLKEAWSDNGVPYQLCDHICEPYRFKNGKVKWPTCSVDIDGFCNDGELPRMVRVGCMTYFQDHQWYDELTEGVLKEEALMHKARFEGSWGYATLGVMKFCAWLKNSFESFHELDHDVLVKAGKEMQELVVAFWTISPAFPPLRFFRSVPLVVVEAISHNAKKFLIRLICIPMFGYRAWSNCAWCALMADGTHQSDIRRFLALGWLLEEIHVTWAHLEKIQTRLQTYTKSFKDLCKQWLKTASQTDMNDLESDDESVDTPLVSPFPHSDNDSDDGEVLNELSNKNVGMLRREKAINNFDGDDLAFQNFSLKTKKKFLQTLEMASGLTPDGVASQVIFDEKKLGSS
ncbi:hypothetical protein Tco_1430151 [Tanacetum coccineum]